MAVGKFTPNNKGKFKTSGGKRVFPPEWYAAQAARRKKNADGSYKEGTHKVSTKRADSNTLPSAEKPKRVMPESWYKKQAERAKARKEAEKRGEYKRKVRGKARDYKDKDIADSLRKPAFRKIETDTYESASYAVTALRKGHRCEIANPKGPGRIELTILGDGFYPMTRRGISKDGKLYSVSSNNIKASWVL